MNDLRFDFTGRTVVVTGAGNGIGAACARLFGASGANVALWDRDTASATAIASEIDASRQRARALQCDVSRSADVATALATTLQAFGRVDILINNAGIFRAADFLDISEDDWDAVLDVNLKGSFLVGQAVARAMAATARRAIGVDAALAITGIAGPGGGSPGKPVGTVWLATASRDGAAESTLLNASGDRDAIRRVSVERALELLLARVEATAPSPR